MESERVKPFAWKTLRSDDAKSIQIRKLRQPTQKMSLRRPIFSLAIRSVEDIITKGVMAQYKV